MTRSRDVANTQTNSGGAVSPFLAGKNKIINGDFAINQRAFTSTTTSGTYGFDRWRQSSSGGTTTTSAQTFTVGAAPVAGYESINFLQIESTGQTLDSSFSRIEQRIEDVRTFANQTVTVSFWAKATSGTPKIAVEISQGFGTSGSSGVNTYAGQVTTSTSWVRYSVSVAVPSVSGKTIGSGSYLNMALYTSAGNDFNARTGSLGLQTATIGFWGVQLEAGSVATPFTTATGTLAGELAACQRYGYALNQQSGAGSAVGTGFNYSTTQSLIYAPLPVQMRVVPTVTYTSTPSNVQVYTANGTPTNLTAISGTNHSLNTLYIATTVASGLVAGNGTTMIAQSGTAQILFASAEL